MRSLSRICAALSALLLLTSTARAEVSEVPFDAELEDIVAVRISDNGLQFLAKLLGDGLLQPTLKGDVISALEDERFSVLIPTGLGIGPIEFGGEYADFVVDFGELSDEPEEDGFRYDDLTVELSTVPASTNLVPEGGVLYPRINLLGWSGSTSTDTLPELWLRVNYTDQLTDVPGVARARLSTAGILRPTIGPGVVGFLVEDFDTQIEEFKVSILGDGLDPNLQELIGQTIQDEFSKELEDALSDVLQQGINDILFDRDLDGEADTLLALEDIFSSLNDALDTDFGFTMTPDFQTNATFPTTVLLSADGSMFLNTPGDCVGPDVNGNVRYTNLEIDGVAGHDPPQIVETAAGTTQPAQFVITLSDDFMNQILFNAYRSGFACLFLNPNSPDVPTDITDLLVTESLSLFVGDWLTDLFPEAPIGFRLRMLRAPTVTIPKTGTDHLVLTLPSLQVDLMIYDDDRWLRLMGAGGALELRVAINDVSLDGEQFIDADFSFDLTNVINFDEFAPDRRSDLQDLLPTAISLAEGSLSDLLGSSSGDITTCVDGIDVSFFQLDPLGFDPDQDLAHYLGLWLSLEGTVDLAVLFECLLGEPLVPIEEATSETTSETAASAPTLAKLERTPLRAVLGTSPFAAESLVGADVVRWRYVPGFWHPADSPVPGLPLGVRTWEWENESGQVQQLRLMGGYEDAAIQGAYDAGTLTLTASHRTAVPPQWSRLQVFDGEQLVAESETSTLVLGRGEVRHRYQLVYTDAWGRNASSDLADYLPDSGCGVAHSPANALLLVALLLVWALWLRRPAAVQLRR